MENKINEIKLDNTRPVIIIGTNFNSDTIGEFLKNPEEMYIVEFTDDEMAFNIDSEIFQSTGYNTIFYKDNLTKAGNDLIVESIRTFIEDDECGIVAYIELENCSSIKYHLELEKDDNEILFDANIYGDEGILYELEHLESDEKLIEFLGNNEDILDECDWYDIKLSHDGTVVQSYNEIELDFWD